MRLRFGGGFSGFFMDFYPSLGIVDGIRSLDVLGEAFGWIGMTGLSKTFFGAVMFLVFGAKMLEFSS